MEAEDALILVKNCKSFGELSEAIQKIGQVKGSNASYTPGQMVETIDDFRKGIYGINGVTRAYGIRDKVAELSGYSKGWSEIMGEGYSPQGYFSVNLGRDADSVPEVGYKIHVAAGLKDAGRVAEIAIPILQRSGVAHKIVSGLEGMEEFYKSEKEKGKFITVYPRNSEEALIIASELDDALASVADDAIDIKTDRMLDGKSGRVFYRYGRFKEGSKVVDPSTGELWEDNLPGKDNALPGWVEDVFKKKKSLYD